jgi:hypothetical protein
MSGFQEYRRHSLGNDEGMGVNPSRRRSVSAFSTASRRETLLRYGFERYVNGELTDQDLLNAVLAG